jgi:geranylgeranyl transferase type-1 subunit beta
MSGSSEEEPHGESLQQMLVEFLTDRGYVAGYAYCAISALSLLDRPADTSQTVHESSMVRKTIKDLPALISWLVSRQFEYHDPPEDDDEDSSNFIQPPSLSGLGLSDDPLHGGFNGRCNKVADTCYTWWVSGCLSILGRDSLLARDSARRFLLEKGQHLIGGFAKYPGGPPDLYHAYFGLTALSTLGDEPNLRQLDASLAVSVETRTKIEAARRGLLRRA